MPPTKTLYIASYKTERLALCLPLLTKKVKQKQKTTTPNLISLPTVKSLCRIFHIWKKVESKMAKDKKNCIAALNFRLELIKGINCGLFLDFFFWNPVKLPRPSIGHY